MLQNAAADDYTRLPTAGLGLVTRGVMMLDQLKEYLPFLIPLAAIQLGLMLAAVIHILRHRNYQFGNRIFWLLVSIFLNIIGPVLYFTLGRKND